jgi:hypothetical protein
MIRISKLFRSSFAVALLLTFVPAVYAQTLSDYLATFLKGRNVGRFIAADDTSVAILIKHIGTAASGIVDVAANGDITLKTGAVGSEAVDTSIECDASIAATGSRNGIIDVSTTPCDTIGEVLDIINSQQTAAGRNNWVAVGLDSLRSDSSNDTLVTITGSNASVVGGLGLTTDTDVAFTSTIALVSPEARRIEFYLSGVGSNVRLQPNPFVDTRAFVSAVNAFSTYGSGSSSYRISQVLPSNKSGASTVSSETVTPLYGDIAAGATTVNKIFVAPTDNSRIVGDVGTKLVARLTNTAAMATVTHNATGIMYSEKAALAR